MSKATLRILNTTDIHMDLSGLDCLTGERRTDRGLANLAPLIAEARAGAAQSLLFDNGDFLQGNALADRVAAQEAPHPMIAAFNLLGYDAIAPGNHDFDYGLPTLLTALSDARMPVVCANLRRDVQQTLFAPWTILTRDMRCDDGSVHVLRIGVIGFAPPQTVDWNADLLTSGVTADDMIAAARTYLPQLQRAGADIVVALCHTGLSDAPAHDRMENAALPLARMSGIDIVLTGHTHHALPGPDFDGLGDVDATSGTIHTKPALMAQSHGKALGILDLDLTRGPDGWQITGHTARLQHPAAAGTGDDADAIRASVAQSEAQTLARLSEPLTQSPRRLTSYLAAIGLDETAPLVADAMIAAAMDALADTAFADHPILAATTTFAAGGQGGPENYIDLGPGPITRGDVTGILPFNNPLCLILRRGWQLRGWLEKSSAYFNTLTDPSVPQPLIRPEVPHFHFDTLHGLRYRLDLRVNPRDSADGRSGPHRVRDLTCQGRPVRDDDTFIVAVSSFRALGGGGLLSADRTDIIHSSTLGLQEILSVHLRDRPIPKAAPPPVWRFVPIPGARVTFLSAPETATLEYPPTQGIDLQAGDSTTSGFRQFILAL